MILDILLFFYFLIIAPKLLMDRILKGKKHPKLLQRLGFQIPKVNLPVIWIHAVSVGEVKAAQPLFRELKSGKRGAFFLVTTATATGQAEARRSLCEADGFAYLPLDFSWVVKRFVKKINPRHFILIESDFWPHLLSALKKNGTRISLVSGKMSERSCRRFQKVPFFAKWLFAHFDHICVQNEDHFCRFAPFIEPRRLQITGNLKFDQRPQEILQKLSLPQPVITISCTHFPEEDLLLEALAGGNWHIILAPRHPERFNQVAELLKKKGIPYSRFSKLVNNNKVLLLDAMGQLPICYAYSRLAIVGGSFIDRIGGHNVLEPCLYGTPVLFGPYMQGQMELAKEALVSKAGLQIPLEKIRQIVEHFFANPNFEEEMKKGALEFVAANRGAAARSLAAISYTSIH